VALGRATRSLTAASFDPFDKSVRDLQRAMTAGHVSSAQLVRFYLDRIVAYDQVGPSVNAVLYVNPNAAAEAQALDVERARRGPRGPLHGIPVLLKDNFDTKDLPTTGGALALSGLVPKEDAFQVRRLRDAGAVMLGKVNLHELALGLTTVSSLGGQTLDPYDLTRAPGGSSGGSAVAAVANFAAFTLGTDTSGSIRIPSSHNNVVGLRPSLGLSSRAGIIPFGHTQDTGGPIARTVADIAIILDATVGFDPADPVTATSKRRIPRTYTASLKRNALDGARVGMLTEFFGSVAGGSGSWGRRATRHRRNASAWRDGGRCGRTGPCGAIDGLQPPHAGAQVLSRRLHEDVKRTGRVRRGAACLGTPSEAASGHSRHRERRARRLPLRRRIQAAPRGTRGPRPSGGNHDG
jgi:Asp-tRNA(Asn)/Glu-tRNA(Gln) amidotransferase A subunit family amidase